MMTLLLLLSMAHAASVSRSVAIQIDHTTPSTSVPSTQVVEVVYNFGVLPSSSAALVPDFSVASSWSPLSCDVEGGFLNVTFSSTRGTWPSTWPSSATCSISNSGNDYTLTINMTECTSGACMRGTDNTGTVPACGSSMTIASSGLSQRVCELPDAPTGKVYAIPPRAWHDDGSDLPVWSSRLKLGTSYDPDNDPPVPGVICGFACYGTVSDPTCDLMVVASDTVRSDLTVYCPMRVQTTSTKAFSWTTSYPVTVDRP